MQKEGKKYLQKLGSKIREYRDAREISQQELADLSDVAKSTIQRIEKGEMNPSILTLKKISLVLEVELVELIKEGEK